MTITVTRSKLYPTGGRARRVEWKWTYDYVVEGQRGKCQYGTDLGSLRGMLHKHFPNHTVIEAWKDES